MIEKWESLGIKDRIQYGMAVLLIVSGIAAAFVSILFNAYNISAGVLIYIAQAFITSGGIFGVSIYFKTKLGEFDTRAHNEINEYSNKLIDYIDKKYGKNTSEN